MSRKNTILIALIYTLMLPVMLYADPAADAEKLIEQRKFDEAVQLLQQEIEEDPGYAELHYLLGKIYYITDEYDLAEAELEKCLDRKRNHEKARYYMALVHIEKERWEEALEILEDEIEDSDDNKALFYNGLGLYHMAREEYNDADLQFRLALIEDPDNLEFQLNMANLSFEQGIYAVAAQGYQKVIEQDSTDVEAYFRLGKSYYFQKMFGDALIALNKAIALDSNYVEAYELGGNIFMLDAITKQNQGNMTGSQESFSSAVWMFNKYLDLGGEETALIDYRLGQALFFLNVYEESIGRLNKAVEKGIEKADAYNLLAKAHFRLRQYDQAFNAYDMYEEMESGGDPNYQWAESDFEFFKEKAQTLFQLYNEGRQEGLADSTYLEQAAEDYERAIQLKPDDPIVPQLYVQLGLTYYYLGEYEKAIPWFEKKIEIDPDVYNTYLNLAYCYLKMEDFETAIDQMVKVTELNPEYCLAYKTIANSYLVSIKDRVKAAEWYEKWSECEPDSYEPYKWLGYLAISAKPAQKDRAIRYLLIAVDKMQAAGVDLCSEPDILTWLAQAHNMYNDLDKEDQAVKWAKRGLKCDPDNEDLKQIIEELDF